MRKVIGNQRSAIGRRFAASLSGRWSLIAFNAVLSLLGICFPAPLRAQDLGNVGLRSVYATLANGGTCTGSPQTFSTSTPALQAVGFRNLGQIGHQVTATSTASTFILEIDGIDTLGNVFRISDLQVGTPTSAKGGLVVTGNGLFSNIQVSVTCSAASTFSLSYSGTFVALPSNLAGALLVATDKLPFQTAPANATASTTFQSPSGNSGGTILFQYSGAGPSGSSIAAQCVSNAGANLQAFTFPLSTVATPQFFQISQTSCPFVTMTYTSGGASAVTYNLEYIFNQSGTVNTLSTSNSGPSSTIPIQVVSDSVSQAYLAETDAASPGIGNDLLTLNVNGTGKSVYLDKLTISSANTSAIFVVLFVTTTTGSGCTALSYSVGTNTITNQKIGSAIQSAIFAGTSCSTPPTKTTEPYLFTVPPNGAPLVLDLRGLIIPAGSSMGIDVVCESTTSAGVFTNVSWYEK